ncbi:MAG: Exporter of the superfamily [Pedosphaera sp.]|nr:Exporter of the superfamily [Pedosphaera sp.]
MFARLLRRLAQAVCERRNWFVYPQILLFFLSVLYALHSLKLDMNRDNLIGEKSRQHQIYLKFRKEFTGTEEIAVVVESGHPELNRQFIERLAAKLETHTDILTDLFYKADLTTLGPKALLLVPEQDLEEMRKALHENRSIIQQFAQTTNLTSLADMINRQFRTANRANQGSNETLIRAIPGFHRIIEQAKQSLLLPGTPPPPGVGVFFGMNEEARQQSYITVDKGRIYLLTVRTKSDALKPQAIELIRQLIQETEGEAPGLNAGLTGGPVLDYDEMNQSEHDSIVASIVSLTLCSLIFIYAYRQVRRPLKAAVCLLIGLGFTMGFTTLTIGSLNILTITFAPMLIGLAIDFGVHFISRYEEEMRHGRTEVEAVNRVMVFTGQGIVTGALTTAAAFLAMGLTRFKGIQQMGIISGGGLILCLIPMLTVLPVLLMRGRENLKDQKTGVAVGKRARIEELWLQRPMLVMLITLGLCAGALLEFRHVHFDYDLLHLQSKSMPSVIYEQLLIKSASKSTLFGTVMADNPQQAHEYEEKLKQLPAVSSVESVAHYFAEDQSKKLDLARAIKKEVADIQFAPVDRGPVDLHQLDTSLWYLTGYLGLAADAAEKDDPALARQLRALREAILDFRRTLLSGQPQIPKQLREFQQVLFNDLRRTFKAIKNQDATGPLRPQDLPPSLRDRFIGVSGKYLLQVYPKHDIWQRENQSAFIQQLRSVIPEDRIDGTPIELYEYTTLLKVSYQHAAWYALGAIVIMIYLHFRSLVCVILSLLPVAVGTVWLLGFMGLTGTPFNPANIMTLPLVIGIGVTNGIQILNRLAEEQKPGVLAKSTGKAVLVSGLTAITGFGSLILAKHQGIKSLGIVMSVGIASCMVAGLTFLPALLNMLMRTGWRLRVGREEKK